MEQLGYLFEMLQFPREVGTPARKVVYSPQEFTDFINSLNGKQTLFTSVYSFNRISDECYPGRFDKKPDYTSAIVDCLYFDFDSDESYEKMLQFRKTLAKHDYKIRVNRSGRGFHIYVKTSVNRLQNPDEAIKNASVELLEESGLTYGNGRSFDCDISAIGTGKLRRIENTWHLKAKKYCVSLPINLLDNLNQILDYSSNQHFENTNLTEGTKLLDLTQFDRPASSVIKLMTIPSNTQTVNDYEFPPCIINLLNKEVDGKKGWINFAERFQLGIYFMLYGLSPEQVVEIYRKYLHPDKFEKAIIKERHHLEPYKKLKWSFSHRKMRELAVCPFSDKTECKTFRLCE